STCPCWRPRKHLVEKSPRRLTMTCSETAAGFPGQHLRGGGQRNSEADRRARRQQLELQVVAADDERLESGRSVTLLPYLRG
ncbi:unnamed protein product, partial [Arctogadus glacialis]